MTRMAHRVIQEDDGWPSEEYPVRPTQSLTSNSEKASVVYGEDVDVTSGIGSSAQAWSPPQSYPSYEPNCTNIVRGGFGAAKENTRPGPSKASRQYPPPSNADYDLTSDGRHPKYRANFKPSLDEAAIVKESIKQQHAEEESHRTDTTTENSEGRKTGEDLAKDINFNRPTWITTTPGSSGVIYPANEQRQDFIDNINAGAELEYCMKCKKKHIPPGSPITLQDRDTCGAYLPDWFPAKSVDKPWDTFTSLLNEKLILDEILQGFTHKPNPEYVFLLQLPPFLAVLFLSMSYGFVCMFHK
jgi:hypothetical protein